MASICNSSSGSSSDNNSHVKRNLYLFFDIFKCRSAIQCVKSAEAQPVANDWAKVQTIRVYTWKSVYCVKYTKDDAICAMCTAAIRRYIAHWHRYWQWSSFWTTQHSKSNPLREYLLGLLQWQNDNMHTHWNVKTTFHSRCRHQKWVRLYKTNIQAVNCRACMSFHEFFRQTQWRAKEDEKMVVLP